MENTAENKMGVMPIGKLVLNMSVPMMISMLVQALYNVVDSIFVSMVSEEALSACLFYTSSLLFALFLPEPRLHPGLTQRSADRSNSYPQS